MITRVCEYCGEPYQTYPSVRKHYCSIRCAGAAKRTGEMVPCVQCGALFYRHICKLERRYCSQSCAVTARNLTEANPAYHRDISGDKNPMHGRGQSGAANGMFGKRREKSPRWNGGERQRKDGYVICAAPEDHPRPCDTTRGGLKYVLKHRLVMEEHLCRYLNTQEVVHHKDGNPANNSIENLELFSSQSEHMSKGHG